MIVKGEFGEDYWSCTNLNGFADRCLSCSAKSSDGAAKQIRTVTKSLEDLYATFTL